VGSGSDAGSVEGKYFFWVKLPLAAPKSLLERVLFSLGFVSKAYVLARERRLLTEYNQHVYDTVISDRKALLEKLGDETQAVSEGLLERIGQVKAENEKLAAQYAEVRRQLTDDRL